MEVESVRELTVEGTREEVSEMLWWLEAIALQMIQMR